MDPIARTTLDFPEMDEQHRYLYELFDLIEVAPAVSDEAKTKALLAEIERYLMYHFACEERLMRTYDFPGFAVHQSDHEQAEARFVQFLDDLEVRRLNPGAVRIFLAGWLSEHGRISDSGYVSWINARREELRKRVNG